jgi:hypothetical protein
MADEREQDGLGRDAAHGDDKSATTGGSYGRNTGRSSDDLLELGDQSDAGDRHRDAGSRRQGGDDVSTPRGTDEHADAQGGGQGSGRGGDDTELDLRPDAGRRDPTR